MSGRHINVQLATRRIALQVAAKCFAVEFQPLDAATRYASISSHHSPFYAEQGGRLWRGEGARPSRSVVVRCSPHPRGREKIPWWRSRRARDQRVGLGEWEYAIAPHPALAWYALTLTLTDTGS